LGAGVLAPRYQLERAMGMFLARWQYTVCYRMIEW
jgi:hypothetical protein